MKIILAGGSGFLGGLLGRALARGGHDVIILTRSVPAGSAVRDAELIRVTRAGWQPDGTPGLWAPLIEGADALVNLAGESIGARRWSTAQKRRLRESRLLATRSITSATRAAARPPAVLVSASAIGYYGDRGEETLTESAEPGTDFLARLAVEWEQEATRATPAATRLVIIRTGLVLHPSGGVLPRMVPPFKMFVGGPLGSGRQYMSWIHHEDWVALVRWAIDSSIVSGPINCTAPNPATNAEFSRALGHALGRPSWLSAPAFALRLLLGEMAVVLLLSGQRVIPARALELGFEFQYEHLDQAFSDIFQS